MSRKKLMLTTLMAVLAAALFVAACNDAPSPTAPLPPTEDSTAAPGTASLVAGQPEGTPETGLDPGVAGQPVPVEMAAKGGGCSGKKVALCHLPPGNADNIQEICISENAVSAHEAHGDYAPFLFWPDADGDGFGDAAATGESGCTVPPGYVENQDDCDDGDAAVNPDAAEVCDGVDNNCNGEIDEGGVCVACPCFTSQELLVIADGETETCSPLRPGLFPIEGSDGETGNPELAGVQDRPVSCFYAAVGYPRIKILFTSEEFAACYDLIEAECARRGF